MKEGKKESQEVIIRGTGSEQLLPVLVVLEVDRAAGQQFRKVVPTHNEVTRLYSRQVFYNCNVLLTRSPWLKSILLCPLVFEFTLWKRLALSSDGRLCFSFCHLKSLVSQEQELQYYQRANLAMPAAIILTNEAYSWHRRYTPLRGHRWTPPFSLHGRVEYWLTGWRSKNFYYLGLHQLTLAWAREFDIRLETF